MGCILSDFVTERDIHRDFICASFYLRFGYFRSRLHDPWLRTSGGSLVSPIFRVIYHPSEAKSSKL